jgi:ketosteroid isomerase-like protein
LPHDFDQMALVVDWLDACRSQNLEMLLDLYAEDATLECRCENVHSRGRSELAAYWGPRLASFAPNAFGLEEIKPVAGGVMLDYSNFQGEPVRICFTFDDEGKILRSRCEPVSD